ncbi:hypothetical protein GCM10022381_27520 [Leifsonia kafniensis]|uniref:Uncharacterized protein n=1 Tax=Leifsonia kafniensis TaxID=475957 RepID=A0ABP7KPA0_9MICO
MPAQPRIAFSSFPSASDLQFAVWKRVNARILGGVPTNARASNSAVLTEPVPSTAPRGVWQLLAANNRELGRSALAYSSFRDAFSHVARVREMATQLALRVERHHDLGTWFWVADYVDEPVITSARLFGSASEAAKTATGAVLAFSQATIDDKPRSRPGRRCPPEPARENSDSAPW